MKEVKEEKEFMTECYLLLYCVMLNFSPTVVSPVCVNMHSC